MRQLLNLNFKKLGFTFLSALAVTSVNNIVGSQEAFAVVLINFATTDFTVSNANGSTGDNNVSPSTAINSATFGTTLSGPRTSPNGFGDGTNGFFTSNFLLLGARATDSIIPTDSDLGANSFAQTANFNLTAADILGGFRIKYNYAFNGNSFGIPNTDQDNFTISLNNVILGQGFGNFIALAATGGYSRSANFVSDLTPPNTFIPLQPGSYFLRITLNENNDGFLNSSAAGFNNISFESVPFEYSQELGLFAVGGLFGAYKLRQRSKSKKNIESENQD